MHETIRITNMCHSCTNAHVQAYSITYYGHAVTNLLNSFSMLLSYMQQHCIKLSFALCHSCTGVFVKVEWSRATALYIEYVLELQGQTQVGKVSRIVFIVVSNAVPEERSGYVRHFKQR